MTQWQSTEHLRGIEFRAPKTFRILANLNGTIAHKEKSRMTSRERVLRAINHQEPDRVPLDLGATRQSGISASAYHKLKNISVWTLRRRWWISSNS
jgi:hypothetical protein